MISVILFSYPSLVESDAGRLAISPRPLPNTTAERGQEPTETGYEPASAWPITGKSNWLEAGAAVAGETFRWPVGVPLERD